VKVLVVYAHPNPKSFNHAILEEFTRGLEDGGHSFEVVDLYAINFDPITKLEDLVQFSGGQMPGDVLEQQGKVTASDALVFIHPTHDWTYPAILKGWIIRVIGAYGFGYKVENGKMIGLLTNKKALFITTTGAVEEYYQALGLTEAYMKISNTSFKHLGGIPDVKHVTFYGVPAVDDETRKNFLEKAYQLGKEF
jgi:NAD(P)H dehydrogenase (quinone)